MNFFDGKSVRTPGDQLSLKQKVGGIAYGDAERAATGENSRDSADSHNKMMIETAAKSSFEGPSTRGLFIDPITSTLYSGVSKVRAGVAKVIQETVELPISLSMAGAYLPVVMALSVGRKALDVLRFAPRPPLIITDLIANTYSAVPNAVEKSRRKTKEYPGKIAKKISESVANIVTLGLAKPKAA